MMLFDLLLGGNRRISTDSGENRQNMPRASSNGVGQSMLLTDDNLAEFMRTGRRTASGMVVTPGSAMRQAVANRCVNLQAEAIGSMALDIKQKGKDGNRSDANDSPAAHVLRRRPNHWQTPTEFRRYLMQCVLLRGNGYALKVVSRGKLQALFPLNPDRMTVVQNADLSLTYEYQQKSGGTVKYTQAEIFHVRGISDDTFTGVSVISYAANALGLSDAMQTHASSLFRNGAAISGVFKHPKTMGDGALKRFKASLDEYRGALAAKSHQDIVLEEGMTYDRMGMTSVDAQLLQLIEASDYTIAMFFGVPPHMLGMTTKTTSFGSGVEQMSIGFVAYTLFNWMRLWEQSIERDLLTEKELADRVYAKFNPASLIQGDIKTRYAAYATGRQWGWLSVNDILENEDKNGIGPAGDVYLVPGNMLDASQTPAALPEPTPPGQSGA